MNRAEIIHKNFITSLIKGDLPSIHEPVISSVDLTDVDIVDIFETQVMSRLLDIVSRRLSSRKQSFYTIGSSGHEGNAVIGHVFRKNDPAFLHYRSCAFAIQRHKKLPGSTPLFDTLLSFCASSEDPTSGGRHKVIGSKECWIPPQTSTIASQLPKAVGAAHAIGLYQNVKHIEVGLDPDSIVICSFGDASANHSTAQGAINTAAWAAFQLSPMPIIFICEDNDIGISTPTPKNWIRENFCRKPGIKYIECNGLNLLDTFSAAKQAESYTRRFKKPVFLHVKTVRLMGHAGSDIETSYLEKQHIIETEAQDPLLYTAALLVKQNILTTGEIAALYAHMEQRISRIAEEAATRPKLKSAGEVMHSIWPDKLNEDMLPGNNKGFLFNVDKRHLDKPQPMVKHINLTLSEMMVKHKNAVLLGEDIATKGGVYGVTQGLLEKFGAARVTNTVLDEQSILGTAIGLAQCGYLPIPEIQYLAYVHNAEDQIRGEAASLSFFSNKNYTNPMVIRIAGFAYQKGFGGHFHNDNALAVFRDVPGIIVVTPSNGRDAASILRECFKLSINEQKVVIFIEPIALYSIRDLHDEGDNQWASIYAQEREAETIQYGEINILGEGNTLCILSYANGFYLSCKAEKILREKHNLSVRVVDIRWLHPLPENAILDACEPCEHILIVDECRRSGSISEAIACSLMENHQYKNIERVTAHDSFIPLGEAANHVLPSLESIINTALSLVNTKKREPDDSLKQLRAAP